MDNWGGHGVRVEEEEDCCLSIVVFVIVYIVICYRLTRVSIYRHVYYIGDETWFLSVNKWETLG